LSPAQATLHKFVPESHAYPLHDVVLVTQLPLVHVAVVCEPPAHDAGTHAVAQHCPVAAQFVPVAQ
jgi:hypothetical protein